jgi:putative ABC transport system substrate-binding protein
VLATADRVINSCEARDLRDKRNTIPTSILGVISYAVFFALCGYAQAQSSIARVGVLFLGGQNQPHLESFKRGLRERGFVDGKNITLEYRYAHGDMDRLPLLAAELVQLKCAVIVTTAETGARAARQATKTIPIVLTTGADLVKSGLAESLPKPGGNVTGLSVLEENLSGKRLDILKETIPKMRRVGYLWKPTAVPYLSDRSSSIANPSFEQVKAITQAVGLQLQSFEVDTLAEIEKAFAEMLKARTDALLVLLSPLMTLNSKAIVKLALDQRLPGIYPTNQFAEEGGLIAYGPRIDEMYRRAATYVEKILKGAKPGDLPIEQPTQFDFVINLKTAKQIGLTIPPNVLARADRVIR